MYLPSQLNPRTGEMETNIPRRDIFDEIMANTLATMPLTIMPLMRAGDNGNLKMEFSEPSTEACWVAELVGERVVGEEIDATTDHAWLVVMGYLGQALGLITRLEEVPIQQRNGPKCGPQTKIIELLVGILGGIEYLQDLSLAENPIAKDPTIADAWAQEIFVHYSGVSRTLEASNEETLAAIIEVLQAISRPFIEAAVMETLKREGRLTVDVDLTRRELSPTSTGYQAMMYGHGTSTLAFRSLGQAYEELGRRDEAVAAYSEFLERWSEADAMLQPQVRDVQDRVDALLAAGAREPAG